jgi:hypothetical protein
MAAKNEPVVNVVLQYDGKSVDVEDVLKAAKNNWKKDHKGDVKELQLYLKSEESKAYYVADGETGDMDVFFC